MNKIELKIIYDYVCLGRTLQEIADTRYDYQYATRSAVTKLINGNGFNTAPIEGQGWSGESRGAYPKMSFETFCKIMQSYRGQNIDDFRIHETKINSRLQQKTIKQNSKQTITKDLEFQSEPSIQPRNLYNLKPEEMYPHELEKMKGDGMTYSYELGFWGETTFDPIFHEWDTKQLSPDLCKNMEESGYRFNSLLGWYNIQNYINLNTAQIPKSKRDISLLKKVIVEFDNHPNDINTVATIYDLTLATSKQNLTGLVINNVDKQKMTFRVVLFSEDISPTISFYANVKEERKVLTFMKPKLKEYLITYPNFTLSYDDITNVNSVYLIPRGYRISKISPFDGPVPEHSGILCELLCERL
ncbi:hypothetical protein KQI41_00590 [Tissierella pigra]|uniref:Uncharacterized protein n=1 Tax=Tissierella pigra TaxID=2607614 RepID=A0A6N7XZF9_9FIRM|nr:hypothetical protein [Tissierella pigra]MBU5424890.1 hypothetical protein [Tissierella pigra]MSU01170.1 hypothetical protein [Tissierella pigra]